MGHVYQLRRDNSPIDECPRAHRPASRTRLSWRERLTHEVRQNPLIETNISLAGADGSPRVRRPAAVMVGLGVARKKRISRGIPAGLLGLLLPAECVRRALAASDLVVLIADEHAVRAGASESAVQAHVDGLTAVIHKVARVLGLDRLHITRASDVHRDYAYRVLLSQVSALADRTDNGYVRRQVADVEYVDRLFGGVVKVGWTVGRSLFAARFNDEVAFDRRFRAILGNHVPFVYCKADRTAEDRRRKASPYVVANPATRILLKEDECLSAKLDNLCGEVAQSTRNGARNHINHITRQYFRLSTRPMRGSLDQRFAAMMAEIFGHHRSRDFGPTGDQNSPVGD